MASSAFKSTSKRSCNVSSAPANTTRGRNAPVRRTRSRSVVSRPDEILFSNKRDNPLFSSCQEETSESSWSNLNGRRFRSLSRNPSPESRNAEECDTKELLIHSKSVRTTFDSAKSAKIWISDHPISEPSDSLASICSQVPNWNDGGSGIYFSEAEEQTINEFTQCILSVEDDQDEASSIVYATGEVEKMRAKCDIPNDLVDGSAYSTTTSMSLSPATQGIGTVELVLDIQREYVKELELSEERVRKLRADLAAEEHHGLELGRVLNELLPDSRLDTLQRHRFPRRNSSEQRRMSKRLTDEALAYFDECISISTFDGSDMSSVEDPPFNLQASAPYDSTKSVARGCSTVGATCKNSAASSFYQDSCGDESHNLVYPREKCNVQGGPILNDKCKSYNRRESWSGVQENVRNYSTANGNEKHGCEARTLDRQIDMDDYNFITEAESLLFDKVLFRNRIISGSVAMCEADAFSASSFIF